jgi:hypothetical protein
MASVVSICNVALSLLGDRATLSSIDPPEGSAQADHCAVFWPIARDEAMSSHDWRAFSNTVTTARLGDTIQTNPAFLYAYSLPADYLVAREFRFGDSALWLSWDQRTIEFELGTIENGTQVLFANYEDLSLRYTRRVYDPTKYPAKFVTAIGYLLASYLAGPIIKGKAGVQTSVAMRNIWDKLSAQAAVIDANQGHTAPRYIPAGVRARQGGPASTTIESGQERHQLPFWAGS